MWFNRASKRDAVQCGGGCAVAPTRQRPVDWGLGPRPKALGAAGKYWERFGFRAAAPLAGLGGAATVKYNHSFLDAGMQDQIS